MLITSKTNLMKTPVLLIFVFLFGATLQIHAQKEKTSTVEVTPQYVPSSAPLNHGSKDKIKAEDPFSCSEEYGKVWDLYKSKEYTQSLNLIDQVLDRCDQQSAYYEMKTLVLIKMDRKKEIIEAATKGLALAPKNASLYEIRANTYYFDFQPQKALIDYRQMLKYEKRNARYYNNYLKLLTEMRNDSEIFSVYDTFIKEKKEGAQFEDDQFVSDIYFYTALAYQRQDNAKRAVELLDEAVKDSPDSFSYLNNRALFLRQIGEYDRALADMQKLIELHPRAEQTYIHRAGVYQRLKQYDNARKDLLKALSLGTNDDGVYGDLANMYLQLNDYTNAKKYFEIFLTKNGNSPSALSNYAYALFDMKDYVGSLQNFKKAYALEPEEIDTLVGMAVLYKLTNDPQKAAETLKEIGQKTNYKGDRNLLQNLEKSDYFYSEKFKKEWNGLF